MKYMDNTLSEYESKTNKPYEDQIAYSNTFAGVFTPQINDYVVCHTILFWGLNMLS